MSSCCHIAREKRAGSKVPEGPESRNINHNGFEAVNRKTKLINADQTDAASKP